MAILRNPSTGDDDNGPEFWEVKHGPKCDCPHCQDWREKMEDAELNGGKSHEWN